MSTPTHAEIAAMTPEQATAALQERHAAYKAASAAPASPEQTLLADPTWRSRYLAGGVIERQQMQEALTAKLGAGDRLDQVIAGTAPVHEIETVSDGALTTFKQMVAAADLRALGISPEATRQLFEGRPVPKSEYDAVMKFKADLLSNKEWVEKYRNRDRDAVRQMILCNIVKVGGYTEAV